MAKTIRINSECFALPEGMSTKDIQALAGFLATLTTVQHCYNWDNSDHLSYASKGATVQLEEVDLMPEAEAKATEKRTRDAYVAKRDAEKSEE